jgi:hypothetical protein
MSAKRDRYADESEQQQPAKRPRGEEGALAAALAAAEAAVGRTAELVRVAAAASAAAAEAHAFALTHAQAMRLEAASAARVVSAPAPAAPARAAPAPAAPAPAAPAPAAPAPAAPAPAPVPLSPAAGAPAPAVASSAAPVPRSPGPARWTDRKALRTALLDPPYARDLSKAARKMDDRLLDLASTADVRAWGSALVELQQQLHEGAFEGRLEEFGERVHALLNGGDYRSAEALSTWSELMKCAACARVRRPPVCCCSGDDVACSDDDGDA